MLLQTLKTNITSPHLYMNKPIVLSSLPLQSSSFFHHIHPPPTLPKLLQPQTNNRTLRGPCLEHVGGVVGRSATVQIRVVGAVWDRYSLTCGVWWVRRAWMMVKDGGGVETYVYGVCRMSTINNERKRAREANEREHTQWDYRYEVGLTTHTHTHTGQ